MSVDTRADLVNPLLLLDTLFLIIDCIDQYHCYNDNLVTKVCLKYSSKFLFDNVILADKPKKNFFEILTKSTIINSEIFWWFYNQSYYSNQWTSLYAATKGDSIALLHCRINGTMWNEKLCAVAAENGHLSIVQYLHENGCPWTKGKTPVSPV